MQSTENKTESRPPADVLRLMRDYRQMLLDDSDASWPAGVVAADIGWLLKDTESALAAERDRADRAEARIAEAAALLPRDPYDTHDIGPAYTVEGVDEAFEILNATEATA